MALSGELIRFTYSNSTNNFLPQGDPLISLGGLSPDSAPATQLPKSAPYIQSSLDAISPALNQLSANTIDATETRSIAVEDWVTVVTGVAAPFVAKITAEAAGVLTLDRALPVLTAASDYIRVSKAENIFPDATLAQASAGVVDHRMLYMLHNAGGTEGNMKYWVEKVTPSSAQIEVMASSQGVVNANLPFTANGEDDPFTAFDQVDFTGGPWAANWGDGDSIQTRYSSAAAAPAFDYGSLLTLGHSPVWLRRTIPAGATGGKCVFALFVRSDADPGTPDPDPFVTGFVFEFLIPELTYTGTLSIDRTVYVRGATRVTGTIVDQFGVPVPNLNAWVEIDSGPGTIASDQTARTDANGQVSAVYTAPTTLSTDPVLKLVIPTNSEI